MANGATPHSSTTKGTKGTKLSENETVDWNLLRSEVEVDNEPALDVSQVHAGRQVILAETQQGCQPERRNGLSLKSTVPGPGRVTLVVRRWRIQK